MLSGALEASRVWGTGINRLGWGCISTLLISWALGMQGLLYESISDRGGYTLNLLVAAISLLLVSGLVGAMAITVGSFIDSSAFNLVRRVKIAEQVGKSGNGLLAQVYGDAALRYETAAGARGTLCFGLLAFFMGWLSGSIGPVTGRPFSGVSWQVVSGIVFSVVFDWLLKRSSTEAFEALEAVLARSEKSELRQDIQ